MVGHHLKVVLNRTTEAKKLIIKYLTADRYFAKERIVNVIRENSYLHVISKFRKDANLRHTFTGRRKSGKGRRKLYHGMLDTHFIDHRRIRYCFKIDEDLYVFSSIVYDISLKRYFRIVYIENYSTKGYANGPAILFSADLNLSPEKILLYYKQRFQIEFLFRAAKNYAVLEHCKVRREKKINFHVNEALTTISLTKALHYLPIPKEERISFSILDIKTMYFNQLYYRFNIFKASFRHKLQ